jgi:hypothetical protein
VSGERERDSISRREFYLTVSSLYLWIFLAMDSSDAGRPLSFRVLCAGTVVALQFYFLFKGLWVPRAER